MGIPTSATCHILVTKFVGFCCLLKFFVFQANLQIFSFGVLSCTVPLVILLLEFGKTFFIENVPCCFKFILLFGLLQLEFCSSSYSHLNHGCWIGLNSNFWANSSSGSFRSPNLGGQMTWLMAQFGFVSISHLSTGKILDHLDLPSSSYGQMNKHC